MAIWYTYVSVVLNVFVCLFLFADIKELESLIPPASTSSSKKNNWETSSTVSTTSNVSQASFAQPHKEGEWSADMGGDRSVVCCFVSL